MDHDKSGEPTGELLPWLKNVRGTQVLPIINSNEPVIRVEAGPGTGKTFGLVRRVQRLLHPDGLNVDGQDVLVVAFNRVIAEQLQQEIQDCLKDSPHNGEPIIKTAHALCLHVVGEDLRILLPHETEAMIYDVLTEHASLRERLNFAQAMQALAHHEAKIHEDIELWQATVRWRSRHKAQLISDLPGLLLDRIKGGDLGDRKYKYVIVDEFQDLTPGLQSLFVRLRTKMGHFMALGDPRQSIYAFLGNDPTGLSKIEELVKPEVVSDITMTECQRCPQQIVEAANQLTALSGASPMVPGNTTTANLHVVHWLTPAQESEGMAKAILENMKANPKDSHLVMVTRRKFGYMLRDELSKLDSSLNVDLSFSESLLETWPVREAFLLFCLLADPDAASWRAWFAYKTSDNGKDYKAPARNAGAYLNFLTGSNDTIDGQKVIALAKEKGPPPGNGGKNIHARAKRYADLKSQYGSLLENPAALVESVFSIDNWPDFSPEDQETAEIDMNLAKTKSLDILDSLTGKKGADTPSARLEKLARILRYQIATKEPFAKAKTSALRVLTLWGAKGVTADHVYLLGLCKEALPGNKRDEYPGTEEQYVEEQRRLFYVSITRARKTMVLSRAQKIARSDAKRLGLQVKSFGGYYPALQMCDFLRDIIKYLPTSVEGVEWKGCVFTQVP